MADLFDVGTLPAVIRHFPVIVDSRQNGYSELNRPIAQVPIAQETQSHTAHCKPLDGPDSKTFEVRIMKFHHTVAPSL